MSDLSVRGIAETRFIELMAQLFQLDEAEALDFGLYRIIRQHNREVRGFIGEVDGAGGEKKLKAPGELSRRIDEAFAQPDHESVAGDRLRLRELENQLGIKPGMTVERREEILADLEKAPISQAAVREYRTLKERLSGAATADQDRAEVLNRLYQFFSRHYQDGDFIVERRYGRSGARYIRSTGEDTEFHWATEDMYYIKSGDIFTDWPVRLGNGRRLVFTVEPDSLQETRASLKPADKAHYELDWVKDGPKGSVVARLKYLKGGQKETHKEEIVRQIRLRTGADENDIKRWLNRYIARNQSDFFIHKRLKDALAEDLDIFIKTEVLDAGQLLAGGDLPQRQIKVARLVKSLGGQIIDFLAVLEDFQKSLWEKKKLVFRTRYVITLDRIEKLAGVEWVDQHIGLIFDQQCREWQELGFGEFREIEQTHRRGQPDMHSQASRYLPLPVDTGLFDEGFKWDLLDAVTRNHGLDEALDGVAIHSDNWQALNTLQEKYRERVKCVYIDPPYNTGGDGFPYKDAYPHASWLAMIQDRLQAAVPFLSRSGALFASIDHVERNALTEALARAFGRKNRVEEIIWGQNTTKGQSPTYSTNHEYVEVFARDLIAAAGEKRMFREPKPGASDLLELVEKLNADYPSIVEIEQQIKFLFDQHRAEFRADLDESGIEYDKNLDPWKGLYGYHNAEYRDEVGKYLPESEAREKQGTIWIWKEGDSSLPKGGGTDNKAGVHTPGHPDYRFYRPLHPDSGEPCPRPKRGWVWPEKPIGLSSSFVEQKEDNRIVWGIWNPEKPKVPQVKKFLHEVDTQVSKSIILDYSDGEKELTNLTGKIRTFPNPKPTTLIRRFVLQTTDAGEWVMDFFVGSGTTYQATLSAFHDDRQRRKVLLVEGGSYFETTLVPRVKRCSTAWKWKDGKPVALNGPGLFLRVQSLEQYEDTLENLTLEPEGQNAEIVFEDSTLQLRYRLDRARHRVYASVDRFASPFGYQLKRAVGGGETPNEPVDLVESLIYLLGLDVARLCRERQGVVITGHNRRTESVSVFFRDTGLEDSETWLREKFSAHPADRCYTNDPASLLFDGCERLESIESVFALQFGQR